MKKLLSIIVMFFPWKIKYLFLTKVWKYKIHPTAKIGVSYFFPKKLKMEENSYVGHFNVAIHLDFVKLGKSTTISRSNWITGMSSKTNTQHFKHQKDRKSQLLIGKESAITKHHHIDCTHTIEIGDYVTVAGYYSQLLTHSIDIIKNRQDSKPIKIGNYSFIGTNSVILGGAKIPSYSVIGAKSLLNKEFNQEYMLYGGVPAKAIKKLSINAKYFNRDKGFVV